MIKSIKAISITAGLATVLMACLFLVGAHYLSDNEAIATPTATPVETLSVEDRNVRLIDDREAKFAKDYAQADFLTATNNFRARIGLGALALNETLNASACAKADDMIAKDYWSHDAPDGTEPWYFIHNAGYYFGRAGENLAYGYESATATIVGWENSPSHRANLEGDFVEMGICSRQAEHYQSAGYQIVTVAHYATP